MKSQQDLNGEREILEEIKEGDEKNAYQAAKRYSYGHSSKKDDRGFGGKEKGTVVDELKIDWKQRPFSKRTKMEWKKDLGQMGLGLF